MLLSMLAFGQPPHPLARIQGKIEGYLATKAVNFYLVRGADRTDPIRTLVDVQTGTFEILDVAPGEYRLRAAQEKARGEVKLTVGSADVSGVSIALLPSTPLLGVMRSVGGRADAIHYPDPCNVNLSQDWSQGRDAVYVPLWQQNGHFTLEGLFPGQYQVRFLCFGAYIQSASFGAADLLRNPVLTIPANGPFPSLEIDYTPGGGTLQATFTDPVLRFDAVLLVPGFPSGNGAELQRVKRFLGVLSDQNMFQFSNLTPGRYTIYTFSKFEEVQLGNPEFLRSLSGGIGVHIEDGETTELTITGASSTVRQVPFKN
jgi:hypothetical protein